MLKPPDLKSRQSIVAFVTTGPTVHIGGFLLRELADKTLWLENEIGEGAQITDSTQLESVLRKFHNKHF